MTLPNINWMMLTEQVRPGHHHFWVLTQRTPCSLWSHNLCSARESSTAGQRLLGVLVCAGLVGRTAGQLLHETVQPADCNSLVQSHN